MKTLAKIFGVAAAHTGLVTASVMAVKGAAFSHAAGIGLTSFFSAAALGLGGGMAGSIIAGALTKDPGKAVSQYTAGVIAGAASYIAGAILGPALFF